jgi:RHS repeat-associated protein
MKRGTSLSHYGFDTQSNARVLASSALSVADSYSYTGFGEEISATSTTTNPHRYGGEVGYYTDNLSRIYIRARHYHPQQGRWMSQDPIGFAGGDWNLYRYVRNNGVNLIDYSGLDVRRLVDPGMRFPIDPGMQWPPLLRRPRLPEFRWPRFRWPRLPWPDTSALRACKSWGGHGNCCSPLWKIKTLACRPNDPACDCIDQCCHAHDQCLAHWTDVWKVQYCQQVLMNCASVCLAGGCNKVPCPPPKGCKKETPQSCKRAAYCVYLYANFTRPKRVLPN